MDTIHKILVPTDNLDLTCINTIRTLSMDAVQVTRNGRCGQRPVCSHARTCNRNCSAKL